MSTLKTSNIQDTSGNNNSTPEEISQGRAKAWITFNGTGTVANRDKFNISTITDNGAGDYTLTFTNNMSSSDYVVVGNAGYGTSGGWCSLYIHTKDGSPYYQEPTTSSFRITISYSGTANNTQDFNRVSLAVFAD
tara:strand:+ start:1075 stop:1479 length:405 start_codon:yes stop_codon:yes gene_type:complete